VRVTHRFQPLFGRDFELVAHRQNWGEDRVHLHDEAGVLVGSRAASQLNPAVVQGLDDMAISSGGARSS
jgi:hypothetical protein